LGAVQTPDYQYLIFIFSFAELPFPCAPHMQNGLTRRTMTGFQRDYKIKNRLLLLGGSSKL
jgi:hypothetical protein